MNAVIGALRVVLGLDSAAFDKGLSQAQSRLGKFGAGLKKGLIAASAAAATAGAALGLALKGALDEADEMSKLASKIGVPIEELSRLKYAADLSGVSIEGVGTSFKKLSTAMVAAQSGGKAQVELFKNLGVAVTNADGSLRSSSAVLLDVADKFAVMEDGATKTALAVQLFGKSGLDMIPFLNGGAAGLKAMTDEAQALGLTISAETGKAAEQFNDNISRLQATLSGLVTQIAGSLAPTLASITDFLVQLSTGFRSLSPETQTFISVGGALTVALAALAIPVGLVAAGIAAIGLPIAGVVAGVAALTAAAVAFWPEIQAAWEWLTKFTDVIIELHSQALVAVIAKFRELGPALLAALSGLGETIVAVFSALPAKMIEIGGQIMDGLIQGIKNKLSAVTDAASEVGSAVYNKLTSYFDINSPSRVMAEIGSYIMQGLGLGMENQKANVVGIAATTSGEVATALKGTETAFQDVGDSAMSAFSGLGSSISAAINGTKEWSSVLSDVIGQLADIALKQLAGSFGGGGGGGFGGIFTGLLGGLLGFANGGSFQVGGAGGVDSQLVAFKASPNETVSVTKPGQSLNSGRGEMQVHVVPSPYFDVRVEEISDGRVAKAAPSIVGQANRNVMPTVAHHQTAKAGGDYRNM